MSETETEVRVIRPQEGPQEAFLSSPADIAIMGGAAGGGKTYGMLLEPLRHAHVPTFGTVIFRRTYGEITREGGMWDESGSLYPDLGAVARVSDLTWRFPSGAKVQFGHLQHESDRNSWKGAQIALLGFDQLEDFTAPQFWYLLSRNRSVSGVRPYVRATCNPDADSWLAAFIAWWINQETGYPILERSGVLRWMVREGDQIFWGDSRDEMAERFPGIPPKSVTFIPAKLEDNRILEEKDPGYRATLMGLPYVERERLLGGNWKIRPKAGLYFQRGHFEIVDAAPADCQWVRAWDLAATAKKTAGDNPDYTVGLKLGKAKDGRLYVAHVERQRASPGSVKATVKNLATSDGKTCRVRIPQDPGQAGKAQVADFALHLAGWVVRSKVVSGDKVTRAGPVSSQCEAGNVLIVRGPWNEAFLTELENFPPEEGKGHDDQVDALADAFDEMVGGPNAPLVYSASAEPEAEVEQARRHANPAALVEA